MEVCLSRGRPPTSGARKEEGVVRHDKITSSEWRNDVDIVAMRVTRIAIKVGGGGRRATQKKKAVYEFGDSERISGSSVGERWSASASKFAGEVGPNAMKVNRES